MIQRVVQAECTVGHRRVWHCFFFFQAEDGIRDLVRSRGLGDVYKRQELLLPGERRRDDDIAADELAPLQLVAERGRQQALSLIHI